jgi:transposase
MRPSGTTQHLARRRERALDLLRQRHGPTVIAQSLGVTPQSVCRWRREAQHPRHPAKHKPGCPRRLSDAQLRRLASTLKLGALAHGYAEDYWTLDRMAHLIWDLFQVRYSASGVWYVLQRLGWSCQKPQRRSLARDEVSVEHWKRYVWPQIKKVA